MKKLTFFFILLVCSCSSSLLLQGVKGQVFWISGNQMPGPGHTKSSHYGVQREILIYELTTTIEAQLTPDGFFGDIQTRLIMSVTTKADGSFNVKLPVGKYSVFVKEEKGLYANLFDEKNAINPVEVSEKQYTWLPITIDYEAAY